MFFSCWARAKDARASRGLKQLRYAKFDFAESSISRTSGNRHKYY